MDTRTQKYFDQNARTFDSIYHEGQPLQRAINRWLRKAIYERFGPLIVGEKSRKTPLAILAAAHILRTPREPHSIRRRSPGLLAL